MTAVTDLAGKWNSLGVSLGMRAGDLEAILPANPHSPTNCLMEMLLRWLRQSYNVCTTDTSSPLPHFYTMFGDYKDSRLVILSWYLFGNFWEFIQATWKPL